MKRRRVLPALVLVLGALAGLLVTAQQASAAGRAMPCLPVSGLGSRTYAQTAELFADGKLVLPGFPAVAIGTSGTVNWRTDPFHSYTWRAEFLSLKWLDQFTKWFEFEHTFARADPTQRLATEAWLVRAQKYAASFEAANRSGGGPVDAWTAMYAGQRATVFTCLDYLVTTYGQPRNPGVRAGIYDTARWLHDPAHDPGSWNQGVDAYVGLLASGCAYGSSAWRDHAATRLNQLVTQTIASNGSLNEQAPGYGFYLWSRWGAAAKVFTDCALPVPTNLAARRAALLSFLAWSSEPNGDVAQLGDSFRSTISPTAPGIPGSPVEWTGSKGVTGVHPAVTHISYSTGWAFGRSTWDPLTASTWYALRYGPGRKYHGHDDHQSVLLDALGHQVLVDSGHYGYTKGAYRDYLVSPAAHNVLTVPGVPFASSAATTVTRAGGTGAWRWYELVDTAYGGRTRARSVLVDTALPLVVVFDRASRATAGSFQQLWHLPPGSRVVVPGRSSARATSADGLVTTTFVQLPLPGQTLTTGATGVVAGRTSPYQGWVSYSNGKRAAAPTVVMSRKGTSAAIVTVVVPAPTGTSVSASLVRGSDGWYHVTVVVGGVKRYVRISGGGLMA